MSRRALAVAALFLLPVLAAAQGTIQPPIRPPVAGAVVRLPGDTLARRDSSADSTAIRWADPDSTMKALMVRPGYNVTRYQGTAATFVVDSNSMLLAADSSSKAQVQRGQQFLICPDSAISYSQGTGSQIQCGGHFSLFDPTARQAQTINGAGGLTYNLSDKSGTLNNISFATNLTGQTWEMAVQRAKFVGDSTAKGETMYARGVEMTSCVDSVPDYYFKLGQTKRDPNGWLYARPAVLYITDGHDSTSAIPMLWLPFFFQPLHGGRHSGILTPRFGVSDIVRNSPTYHRDIENVGYYFAINDYMNATVSFDWRSGAGGGSQNFDPGWIRYNGDWDYKWLDRFVDGDLRLGYTQEGDGSTNKALSWNHNERFAHDASLRMGLNYVSSTRIQRQNTFDPYQATATIRSQINYSRRFGPASLTIGGDRSQYPGRDQVDQTFPSISLASETVKLFGDHVLWTPAVGYSYTSSTNLDQQSPFAYLRTGPNDSTKIKRGTYGESISIQSPISIFGTNFGNSIAIRSNRNAFPQQFIVYDVKTGDSLGTRIFASTFTSTLDWTPGFQLPTIRQGGLNMFKIVPSVSFANVDAGPFFIKTERTDGKWAHQTKRIQAGLSTSPTIYGFFPGLGRFSEFDHVINPFIGYSIAPAAKVSDEYLEATGRTRKGYLGSLAQSAVSFGVSQSIEAVVKPPSDSGSAKGQRIKLLGLTMSSFTYDFRRADTLRATNPHWWRGLTTDQASYQLRSDLFPGFDFSADYSLFQGSTTSDTAIFKPHRESMSASLALGQGQSPWDVLRHLFAPSTPVRASTAIAAPDSTRPDSSGLRAPVPVIAAPGQQLVQPLAGPIMAPPFPDPNNRRGRAYVAPRPGWRMNLTFTSATPRAPVGSNVIQFDSRARCEQIAGNNPFILDACLNQAALNPTSDLPVQSTEAGAQAYVIPPRTNIGGDIGFSLTEHWTASWRTNYDVENHQFAQHIVTLERDLHDWHAMFSFTQSPNGNFAFNFTIGLKAETDFKFDYNRAIVGAGQVY